MSKAKEKYYEFKRVCDDYFNGVDYDIADYVNELEGQNKIMLGALINVYKQYAAMPDGPLGKGLTNAPFFAIKNIIESMTEKPIEEILK